MLNRTLRRGLSLMPLLLSACSSGGLLTTLGPDYQPSPMPTATHWQTPQTHLATIQPAHQGKAADLIAWWDHFQDPILSRLLIAAEQVNASIADAKASIEQARANLVTADAAVLPQLNGELASKRSSASFGGSPFIWNQFSAGLQSSWEVDLFGGLARQQQAALYQLESKNASWHDARVAVAVEVADAYLAYRYCEIQVTLLRDDSDSRQASAHIANSAGHTGFRAAGDVALATASAAEASKTLLEQQAQCEHAIKSLVALTGIEESEMRPLLKDPAEQQAKLPTPASFIIHSLPAQVLLQRPDVAAAERDVAEASANIGVQRAQQYPKLSLSGNITPTLQNINGSALLLAQTWAIGPTINLPLFDAGKRAADVELAQAQYQAAASRFHSKVRQAVKEVENALVRLDSSRQRLPQSQTAANGYRINFQASQTLYQNGLGSLLDVETARRQMLSAELAVKTLEQEQVSAWIALYRAAGGSWSADENSPKQNAGAAGDLPSAKIGNTTPFSTKNATFTEDKS